MFDVKRFVRWVLLIGLIVTGAVYRIEHGYVKKILQYELAFLKIFHGIFLCLTIGETRWHSDNSYQATTHIKR